MINPGYRTAKQGKDDARRLTSMPDVNPARLLAAVAVRFGTNGAARECTTAYRRAFFDTLAVTF